LNFPWSLGARGSLVALAGWLTACSTNPALERVDSRGKADEVDEDAGAARECTVEGSTRACTCTSGAQGQKTCSSGTYGSCESCREKREDAGNTAGTSGGIKCKAGYYVGEMNGNYMPGFAGFGITSSPFAVPFMAEELNGQPPLSLTLLENSTGPAGEFFSYTVNGGCMQGMAKSMGTDNPFVARLTGDLDCSSGAFVGVVEGHYTLLNLPGLEYQFKGPITAQFTGAEAKLADGMWSIAEPAALDGQPAGSGSGTWSASYVSDEAPDAGVDPCQGIVSSGPLDAGSIAGSDAGS
jgi:hypothetical protein